MPGFPAALAANMNPGLRAICWAWAGACLLNWFVAGLASGHAWWGLWVWSVVLGAYLALTRWWSALDLQPPWWDKPQERQ